MGRKKALKTLVDEQITSMMEATAEPSEGRMKLLAIAIKKLALDARLEENDYGGYFNDDESGPPAGSPQGPKAGAGKRAPDA